MIYSFLKGSKVIHTSVMELRDFTVKYELKVPLLNVFACNECMD